MSRTVTIVDYGIGNLFSVARAIEKMGGEPRFARRFAEVREAERLLLPGVGAFGPCAAKLGELGLDDAMREFAASGRPFLGICVGMQLLFDVSFEFGEHAGLGLIPGSVEAIPTEDEGGGRKVPHIGWAKLIQPPKVASWRGSLLEGMPPEASAYFVHSMNCRPQREEDRLADANYEDYRICAGVRKDNVTGFQCHPEKSGPVGLRIIENFISS